MRDDDDCMSSFRQLLEFGNPKSSIYVKFGLEYRQKFDDYMATDYLIFAMELSKQEEISFDFTNLIAKLQQGL